MLARARMTSVVFSLTILSVSCGRVDTFVSVEGSITQDGQPLSGVEVRFLAEPDSGTIGPRSVGTTDENGSYRLRADSGEDGVIVGTYRVCIVEFPRRQGPPGGRRANSKVPPAYRKFRETPLRAKVRSKGIQTFDFDIPPE